MTGHKQTGTSEENKTHSRALDGGQKQPSVAAPSFNSTVQVIPTRVPLSPSSIIWYQPMGGDALCLGR